jgi:DNA-binding LacI/PurR family transcriptional regulator
VEHLLDLGHTRIAAVFTLLQTSNSLDRFHAYEATLGERGISVPPGYTIATEGAFESVDERNEKVLRLLTEERRPTAFFCAGFYSALETIQTARKAGLRVPEDVSVIAFDDPLSAAHITPPLTTIQQPLEVMGRLAMEKLLCWLRTRKQPERVEIVPTRLIVRGSTAPPSERSAS